MSSCLLFAIVYSIAVSLFLRQQCYPCHRKEVFIIYYTLLRNFLDFRLRPQILANPVLLGITAFSANDIIFQHLPGILPIFLLLVKPSSQLTCISLCCPHGHALVQGELGEQCQSQPAGGAAMAPKVNNLQPFNLRSFQ